MPARKFLDAPSPLLHQDCNKWDFQTGPADLGERQQVDSGSRINLQLKSNPWSNPPVFASLQIPFVPARRRSTSARSLKIKTFQCKVKYQQPQDCQ